METATYGSEFVAARTCVDQIIDLRNTLRYMGIPVEDRCYMFGDNESVVNSATTPHGKLHKRHIMLSYHRVREAIASGMIVFTYLPGWLNPADILSKHWSYKAVWRNLKAILFWQGDTANIDDDCKTIGSKFEMQNRCDNETGSDKFYAGSSKRG